MSYLAERRVEEKERRRAEILDAAESLYIKRGWDAVTVDQVARSARLSRALIYVYFKDKEDLLFAIGDRAMRMLRDRFASALGSVADGCGQIEAIGRAYMSYALEFPHYFDFCARFQQHSVASRTSANEDACRLAGDEAIALVVQAIRNGAGDGSIDPKLAEQPLMLAFSLWAFTHGITQITIAKSSDLARHGVLVTDFGRYAFDLVRSLLRATGRSTPGS